VEYILADVERVEVPNTDIVSTLRYKQTGFENDGDFKMVHRYADGTYKYWNNTDVGNDHTLLTNLNSTDYQHLTSAQYNVLTSGGISDTLHHHSNLYTPSNTLVVQVNSSGQVGINGNPVSEAVVSVTHSTDYQLCLYNNSWYSTKLKTDGEGTLNIQVTNSMRLYGVGTTRHFTVIGDSENAYTDSNVSFRLGINSSSACTYKGNFTYDEPTNKVTMGYGTSANLSINSSGNINLSGSTDFNKNLNFDAMVSAGAGGIGSPTIINCAGKNRIELNPSSSSGEWYTLSTSGAVNGQFVVVVNNAGAYNYLYMTNIFSGTDAEKKIEPRRAMAFIYVASSDVGWIPLKMYC
jgi:hypothetical protein